MVHKHLPLFQVLTGATSDQRSAILKTLTKQQLHAVLEAVYNVLHGTCPISDNDKKKLYHHRSTIRKLVAKDLTRKQQHRLLIKYQSILPLLLKQVIAALNDDV